MKEDTIKIRKTAQERQDGIFRKMSADRKIELGSQLWLLAKALVGDKISYKGKIPKRPSSKVRDN